MLTNLILLAPNKELNPSQANSLVSLSMLQHVDQTLNQIKVQCFESLNTMIDYVFRMGSGNARNQSPFMTKSIQILPFVIISARMFASDALLP